MSSTLGQDRLLIRFFSFSSQGFQTSSPVFMTMVSSIITQHPAAKAEKDQAAVVVAFIPPLPSFLPRQLLLPKNPTFPSLPFEPFQPLILQRPSQAIPGLKNPVANGVVMVKTWGWLLGAGLNEPFCGVDDLTRRRRRKSKSEMPLLPLPLAIITNVLGFSHHSEPASFGERERRRWWGKVGLRVAFSTFIG